MTTPLHESCTTDQASPSFDEEWQRRAFGLALALSEFGHYPWDMFQQSLIGKIQAWEATPSGERADWQYYDHWAQALEQVVADCELLTAEVDEAKKDHPKPSDPTRAHTPH
jgi:nitrile hydratase accessory protein